jgi:hypothetical protein
VRRGLGIGQRAGERRGDLGEVAERRAGTGDAVARYERVVSPRLLDDGRIEGLEIVGTRQPPCRRLGEGEIEQRLMALALDDLVRGSARPDGLADAPKTPPGGGVLGDELAPRRDDPPRVGADLGHVREPHGVGVTAQLRSQLLDLLVAHDDEDRLVRLDGLADERRRRLHEARRPGIEHGLVSKRCRRPE